MEICLLVGSPPTSPSVHCNVPFSPPKHKLAQALAGALWQGRSQQAHRIPKLGNLSSERPSSPLAPGTPMHGIFSLKRSRQLLQPWQPVLATRGLPTASRANAGALNKYRDFRVRNFLEPDNAAKNEVVNSCAGTLLGTFWRALAFGSVFLKLADTAGLLIDYTHEWAEQKIWSLMKF